MVDFRYHLVSLISVFLALAVGIVLGAGPLREGISDAITGQVDELRTDRDKLRTRLDDAEGLAEARAALLGELQPAAIADVLSGQSIAVVRLPGAGDGEGVVQSLTQAGAEITADVTVNDELINPDSAAFRASYSGQLAGYLEPAPSGDATTEEILGQAIAQASAEVGNLDNARTLAEILSSTDPQLVNYNEEASAPATAIVVLSGATQVTEETPAPEDTAKIEALSRVTLGVARTLQTVVVGDSQTPTSLLAVIRSGELSETITTVDSIDSTAATINTPRALRALLDGTSGHWGIQNGATASLAPAPNTASTPPADSPEQSPAQPDESAPPASTPPSASPSPTRSPRRKRTRVGAMPC